MTDYGKQVSFCFSNLARKSGQNKLLPSWLGATKSQESCFHNKMRERNTLRKGRYTFNYLMVAFFILEFEQYIYCVVQNDFKVPVQFLHFEASYKYWNKIN